MWCCWKEISLITFYCTLVVVRSTVHPMSCGVSIFQNLRKSSQFCRLCEEMWGWRNVCGEITSRYEVSCVTYYIGGSGKVAQGTWCVFFGLVFAFSFCNYHIWVVVVVHRMGWKHVGDILKIIIKLALPLFQSWFSPSVAYFKTFL